MTTTKKAKTTSELSGGSAERIIEDRGAIGIDGQSDDVNRSLVQPTADSDHKGIVALFRELDGITTAENEYSDVETGEVKIANQRFFWKRVLMGGLVRNIDFLIEKQEQRCNQAEGAVAAIARGKTADEDGTEQARREAWAERETDKLLELVAMRETAGLEYADMIGEEYGAQKKQRLAGGSDARAKARQQAMRNLRG